MENTKMFFDDAEVLEEGVEVVGEEKKEEEETDEVSASDETSDAQ